jgi:hypothetical protein
VPVEGRQDFSVAVEAENGGARILPGAPLDGGSEPAASNARSVPAPFRGPVRRIDVNKRPPADSGNGSFGTQWGWDREYEQYSDFDLPIYVGPSTFSNLPWITDPAELAARGVDVAIVGAPFDDMVTHRPGTRFGPRAIREAQYSSGSLNSLQLDVRPFDELIVVDAGDANVVPAHWERGHAMIYRKVREVAATGAIPLILGGDHSITWPSASAIAEVRKPGSIGVVHFDAHADTAPESFGQLASHGSSNPARSSAETSCRLACAATGRRWTSWSGCATTACAGTS